MDSEKKCVKVIKNIDGEDGLLFTYMLKKPICAPEKYN